MCRKHYHRWVVWGDPLQIGGNAARIEGQVKTCDISGCNEPHEARGWCAKHYTRWRTWGNPHYTARPGTRSKKPRNGGKYPPALAAQINQLHSEGHSFGEIGEQLGLGKNVVWGIYRRSKTPCRTS
jgi:hypothetical protein